jgi:hypothetical protein
MMRPSACRRRRLQGLRNWSISRAVVGCNEIGAGLARRVKATHPARAFWAPERIIDAPEQLE